MAQVTIEVNGRPYQVGCEDGQEAHLKELAALIDQQVKDVAKEVGPLGDTRLLLMASLLMADELADLRRRAGAHQADLARVQTERDKAEAGAVKALETAAAKIEGLGD